MDRRGGGRKKIYTFIKLKIEVPPVIIESTIGSERLENVIKSLNSISTSINYRFILPFFFVFFFGALHSDSNSFQRQPATAPTSLVDLKEHDR